MCDSFNLLFNLLFLKASTIIYLDSLLRVVFFFFLISVMIDSELVFSRIRLVGSGSQVKPLDMTSGVTGCMYGCLDVFLCIYLYRCGRGEGLRPLLLVSGAIVPSVI